MENFLKEKTLKINKDITVICTKHSQIPHGLKLKRDATKREAVYCLKNIMGFNLDLSLDDCETNQEKDSYKNDITIAFNEYLKGHIEWCVLCEETFCYDEDGLGPSIACHLYLIQYLIKKEII